MIEEKFQPPEQDSLIRQKLRARLSAIPVDNHFTQEERNACSEVLDKLPEDLVRLLDEDAIVPNAEPEIADTLKLALERFAKNHYSLHVDDSQIVVYAETGRKPMQSIMLNATTRGDCTYKVYPDTGWALTIPRKFPNSSVIPTLPSSPTPPTPIG